MKKTVAASVLIIAASLQPAAAESCEEKFANLLADGNGDVPVTITITQQIKGAAETINRFRSDGEGNWVTEMVEPASMPWSMVHDNVMYTSSDQGKTWDKLREIESGAAEDNAKVMLRKDAETARDVTCGEETVEGTAYEKVSGTYTSTMLQGAEITNAYWLNSDGWIARHTSHVKSSAYEMDIKQVLEPGLETDLPKPE